jgi:cell division septation protein DedD
MARRQRTTIEFTTLQLATVAAGVLGASAVVFLLGIYVGRGLPIHHAGVDERVARIPVGEAPRMVEVDRSPIGPPADAPREPTVDVVPEPPNVIAEAIATARRTETPAAPAAGHEAAEAKRPPAPQARPDETADHAAKEPAKPSVPYTVQVLATRNREEAMTLADDLKRKRIGAFVSEVEDTGGSWYRVRIGIYDDLESAQVMEARLRKLGLQQAYVSRYR